MEEETKLNQTIVRSLAVCFCVLVATIGGCQAHQNYTFEKGGYSYGSVPSTAVIGWIKKDK